MESETPVATVQLTAEQRARIAENRRIALEKKARAERQRKLEEEQQQQQPSSKQAESSSSVEIVILTCPYNQKDACSQLGGRWDYKLKKWYVPAGMPTEPFAQWLPTSRAPSTPASKRSREERDDGIEYDGECDDYDYDDQCVTLGGMIAWVTEDQFKKHGKGFCWEEGDDGFCSNRDRCDFKHRK